MFSTALRQIAILLAFALVPAFISGAIQLQPARPEAGSEIKPAGILTDRRTILWVDTRPAQAFAAGHAKGAFPLRLAEWDALLPAFLDAWYPEKLVIVYDDGASPDTASPIARRLQTELQMKNVRFLRGGWQRWQEK